MSALAVLFGLLIGASMGCGRSNSPFVSVSNDSPKEKSGEPSKTGDKDEVPKDGVYRSGRQLFARMPKDAYPLLGKDKGIEREEARKWCEKNLVGLAVEWTHTVKKPSVSDKEPYEVGFITDTRWVYGSGGAGGHFFDTSFQLGSEQCVVILCNRLDAVGDENAPTINYKYTGCTAAEAKALRELEGKVTFRAKVTEAKVGSYRYKEAGTPKEMNAIFLATDWASINGILPAALVPKDKK